MDDFGLRSVVIQKTIQPKTGTTMIAPVSYGTPCHSRNYCRYKLYTDTWASPDVLLPWYTANQMYYMYCNSSSGGVESSCTPQHSAQYRQQQAVVLRILPVIVQNEPAKKKRQPGTP